MATDSPRRENSANNSDSPRREKSANRNSSDSPRRENSKTSGSDSRGGKRSFAGGPARQSSPPRSPKGGPARQSSPPRPSANQRVSGTNQESMSVSESMQAMKMKMAQPVQNQHVDVMWGWKTIVEIVILLNAVQLGVCVQPKNSQWTLGCDVSEQIFCVIYTVEVSVKLFLFGQKYFRYAWNCLDIVLMTTAVIDSWILFPIEEMFGLPLFLRQLGQVCKFIRVLRIAKCLRARQELQVVLEGLFGALRSITWIASVLLLLIYTYSIICVSCFSEVKTDSDLNFRTIPNAMFSMFTLAIVGEWGEIVMPVIQDFWWAPLFFVLFVFISAFGILNLIIGVIADRTAAVQREYHERDKHEKQKETFKKIEAIADFIFGTEGASDSDDSAITRQQMALALEHEEHGGKMEELIAEVDLPIGYSILEFHGIFDRDATGNINKAEFTEGMERLLFSNEFHRSCMVQGSIADVLFEIKASETRLLDSVKDEMRILRKDLGLPVPETTQATSEGGATPKSDSPVRCPSRFFVGTNEGAESRAFTMRRTRTSLGEEGMAARGSGERSPAGMRGSGTQKSNDSQTSGFTQRTAPSLPASLPSQSAKEVQQVWVSAATVSPKAAQQEAPGAFRESDRGLGGNLPSPVAIAPIVPLEAFHAAAPQAPAQAISARTAVPRLQLLSQDNKRSVIEGETNTVNAYNLAKAAREEGTAHSVGAQIANAARGSPAAPYAVTHARASPASALPAAERARYNQMDDNERQRCDTERSDTSLGMDSMLQQVHTLGDPSRRRG